MIGVLERWVKSCCLTGELWNVRVTEEVALGTCLRAEVMAKGRRRTNVAILLVLGVASGRSEEDGAAATLNSL